MCVNGVLICTVQSLSTDHMRDSCLITPSTEVGGTNSTFHAHSPELVSGDHGLSCGLRAMERSGLRKRLRAELKLEPSQWEERHAWGPEAGHCNEIDCLVRHRHG